MSYYYSSSYSYLYLLLLPGRLLHAKAESGWAFLKPSVGKEGAVKPKPQPKPQGAEL